MTDPEDSEAYLMSQISSTVSFDLYLVQIRLIALIS